MGKQFKSFRAKIERSLCEDFSVASEAVDGGAEGVVSGCQNELSGEYFFGLSYGKNVGFCLRCVNGLKGFINAIFTVKINIFILYTEQVH